MHYLRNLLCLTVLVLHNVTWAAPTNFLQPYETYFNQQKTRSSSDSIRSAPNNNPKTRSIGHDRGSAFAKNRNLFEEFKIPSDFGNDFAELSSSSVKEVGNAQNNEYYSYSFSTPVENVSGDDVIAVVNVKHSPKVYFYQVAEAGPRHLKVMYFTGFPSRYRATRASTTN